MGRPRIWWLLTFAHISFAEEGQVCKNEENGACRVHEPSEPCSLYLAPSTIADAGLGVFTTKPLHKGDSVLPYGDICIPIVGKAWHYGESHMFWPLKDYTWSATDKGMGMESLLKVEAYCPGLDALPNCHLALVNLRKTRPQYDVNELHRSRNVGAGSFSPYHNGTSIMSVDVPAGGELFADYGDNWFLARQHIFGLIPLQEDYQKAESLVMKLMNMHLSSKARAQLYSIMQQIPSESRTMNALPPTFRDVEIVWKIGIRGFHQQSSISDTTFLRARGRCLDNIVSGPSTIKQAGHGAFATRQLPKGSIITGSPLLIITDRDILKMYETTVTNEGRLVKNSHKMVGWQLLLNYCMGRHPESSLLLCPYSSNVNFINHNQTRANVKIQWSEDGSISHNASYFDLKVHEMNVTFNTNLAMDYVALREIEPGEELFLDYGTEWEEAWSYHVHNWQPPLGSENYVDAATFNQKANDAVLKTSEERIANPYPPNLQLRCHPVLRRDAWNKYSNRTVWNSNRKGIECEILSRVESGDGGEIVYNVRLFGDSRTAQKVPRKFFRFFDKPGTTDIHLPGAFRHAMGIPDDMFPRRWKNRK